MLYGLYNMQWSYPMNKPAGKIEADGMVLHIRKIGNSIGIILPKDFAARNEIADGDKLHIIRQADNAFLLSKKDPTFTNAMAIARKGMKTYRNALAELAK